MKTKRPACPDEFTLDFARELVAYLGGDPTQIIEGDCWGSLGKKYAALMPKVMRYFERAKKGNVAIAAYSLCRDCNAPLDWAKRQIEHSTGDVAWAAYSLCRYCGAPLDWSQRQIERGIGDVAWAASLLCRYCGAPPDWAWKIGANV
ncbi:MAG: hypothetical protein ABIH23_26415 [bacterium]